ncbi:uncharacterized protein LOC129356423 [Poeciliopsis prolifica]|uniref:uncharacterized protein LOC129356423 n=1 Tax=Poeciliopsis prolifica TaxID=188132 RepID=UPI0024143A6B|nr:uncharacterized protein LOC129356423 [Poeciliopsis prolifica]
MKEVYEDPSREAQALISYLKKANARPNTNMALFKAYVQKRQAPSPAHLHTVTASSSTCCQSEQAPDGCHCKGPVGTREAFVSFTAGTQNTFSIQNLCSPSLSESAARRRLFTHDAPPAAAAAAAAPCLPIPVLQSPAELPGRWKEHLPSFQQDWIRKAIFCRNAKTGKTELRPHPQFWWHPPQPPTVFTQPPASADVFFSRPLFLWMPLKMWSVPLVCVQPACSRPSARCWTWTGGMTWPRSIWSAKDARRRTGLVRGHRKAAGPGAPHQISCRPHIQDT